MMTFTTRLLEGLDDRVPRRHQLIIAVLVLSLTILSIAGGRPAERPAPAPPIIIVATATPAPAGARGLAKEAAPQSAVFVLSAPTAAPAPTVVLVEQVAPTSQHVGERESDKGPPLVEQVQIMVEAPTTTPLPSPVGPTGNPPRWTVK